MSMRFQLSRLLAIGALAAAAASAQAASVVVFATDFDGADTLLPGVTVSGRAGSGRGTAAGGPYVSADGKRWDGNVLIDQSGGNPLGTTGTLTELILGNLPAHTAISYNFLLGFLNSWDSNNGSPAPDNLEFFIDDVLVATLTTVTAGGSVNEYGGGTPMVDNGQIDTNVFFSDDLVDMASAGFLSFAHSGSSIKLGIRAGGAGWQGGDDEFWGLDDLRVTITTDGVGVPAPAPWSLLLGTAALAAGLKRRRR